MSSENDIPAAYNGEGSELLQFLMKVQPQFAEKYPDGPIDVVIDELRLQSGEQSRVFGEQALQRTVDRLRQEGSLPAKIIQQLDDMEGVTNTSLTIEGRMEELPHVIIVNNPAIAQFQETSVIRALQILHRDTPPGSNQRGVAEIRTDPTKPIAAPERVGRNALCPCGSGKKYKECHIGQELPKKQPDQSGQNPVQ